MSGASSYLRRSAAWLAPGLSCSAAALIAIAGSGAPTARAAWAVAVAAALLHPSFLRALSDRPTLARRWAFTGALVGGVLASLAPVFSDDLWRYLLDGHASVAGVSPFAYPPASPKVADWVAAVPGAVNHPELPTIYPPLAQALFAAVVAVGGGATAWRLLAWVALLAGAWLLDRTSHESEAADAGRWRARLWATTHPLALIGVASSGHVDAFGFLAGALVVAGAVRGRVVFRVAGWLAGAGLKIVPGAFAFSEANADPNASTPRRLLRGILAALATLGTLAAAWLVLSRDLLQGAGSAPTYATRWSHGGGAGRWVVELAAWWGRGRTWEIPLLSRLNERLGRGRWAVEGLDPSSWWDAGELAAWGWRLLAALVLMAVVLRDVRVRTPVADATARWWVALFVVSPVFHPWYALWLAPFVLAGRAPRAGHWLVTAAPLTWWGAAGQWDSGAWSDPVVIGLLVWLPAILLLGTPDRTRRSL